MVFNILKNIIVILLFVSQAQAHVEITSEFIDSSAILKTASVYVDSERRISIDQVKDFDALSTLRNSLHLLRKSKFGEISGYKGTKVWVIFEITNHTSKTDFVFRYSYPSMQRIEFYSFSVNGTLSTSYQSGKLVPFEMRPMKDTDYLFPMKLKIGEVATIAMSFESSGSLQFPITLMSVNKFHELTQNKYLLFGLYYGVIFLILLYSLFLSVTMRAHLYISYFFYILSVVLAQMSLHGISYRYLWSNLHEWNRVSTIFFVGFMFFCLTIFSIIALDLKSKARRSYHFLIWFAIIAAAISISSLFVYGNVLIRITGLITSILPLIIIYPGIVAWRKGHEFGPYYVTAVCFYLIGASLYGLKDSGILPPNFLTENGILMGSLIEIGIFSLGIAKQIQRYQKKSEFLRIELERSKVLSQIASQVSHDIRSPLSALSLITSHLPQLNEEKRIIIRSAVDRINDIANQLLEKGREYQRTMTLNASTSEEPKCEVHYSIHLLSPLIDSIVSEKRIQFRERQDIEIKSDISCGYGLFARISSMELKRVVSNLVNNSVESLSDSRGKITVAIRRYSSKTAIVIQDNGKGIPEHILKKLGARGVSYRKDGIQNGNGLGIYHAKRVIEDAGGEFVIQSREGCGTMITMTFPLVNSPNWFVEKLVLVPGMTVVSLDDDVSIHQIWKDRFESLTRDEIHLTTFTSGADFKIWLKEANKRGNLLDSDILFLMDYELLHQNTTGLELIHELKIEKKAILVTSRYDEESVRSRCQVLGVKLIPKSMAGLIPVEMVKVRCSQANSASHCLQDRLL